MEALIKRVITNEEGPMNGQSMKEYSHYAKISENAKGEPAVTVSVMGEDVFEVEDDLMALYRRVKYALEPRTNKKVVKEVESAE